MGKAILGWVGALALLAFLVHGFTRPPSPAQQYVLEHRAQAAREWQVRQDNARLACAQGVAQACDQISN